MRIPAIATVFSALLSSGSVQAAPQFVNGLTIPGDQLDLSGGTGVNDGRLGFFSDLFYDPNQRQWWALSDRGPGGGTISYDTRVHHFRLDVNPSSGAITNFTLAQTILFRDSAQTFNGLAPNPANVLGNAFDPEGLVVLPGSGHFLVSDEYGPSLYEFDRSGQFVRAFTMPDNVLPRAGTSLDFTATPAPEGTLTSGREVNRGLEGLAISPDGRYAYAILQNGTVDDGTVSSGTFTRSMYTRVLKFDTRSGAAVAQFAYRLEGAGPAPTRGRGISALVALDENRFLVLELNNRGVGVPDANLNKPDKKVFVIDLSGATDISAIDLAGDRLPAGVVPVAKNPSALADLTASAILQDPSLAAMGGRAPEKWEGLAIGPQLSDGSYVMLTGTDNDYSVSLNSNGTQFDVYYNPTSGARVQCDLGTTVNCTSISTTGSVGSPGNVGNLPAGFSLIPGVLTSWRMSEADVGGYTPPVSTVPGPLPLAGAAAALAWSRRLRSRRAGKDNRP
jgi:hypothetical protein